ncbi:hypothetical protein OSTOST_19130 [Ostertagia ostertagi]
MSLIAHAANFFYLFLVTSRALNEASATMSAEKKTIPNGVKFIFGGAAGMGATLFVQPLDLVKNRMQLSGRSGKREYRSSIHALTSIVRNEGVLAVYNGLSAGLLRQATYTTTRLGTYTYLFEHFKTGDTAPSFAMKASLGMTAGAVGSVVGTPAELALIRMTGDGQLPPEQRRNYKNVFDALIRVVKEEGVFTLWRGCAPTVMRGDGCECCTIGDIFAIKTSTVGDRIRSRCLSFGQGFSDVKVIFCPIPCSMVSGLATTIASMPVDIAKTRIQSMKVIDGKPEYKNAFDVWVKVNMVTKIGPFNYEKWKWPGQNREFPELSPKWHKENPEQLRRYTGVHEEGYVDPVTGKFVVVPEMQAKLVVPNLDGFKLKPYVSYRTDVEIEKRRRIYEAKVKEKGSKALADLYTLEDERWPPPKMDAETLFELSYGEQIRQAYKEGRYGPVEKKEDEKS